MTAVGRIPLTWPGVLGRGLLGLALLVALTGRIDLITAAIANRDLEATRSLGEIATPTTSIGPRWAELTQVQPGGAAAEAGLRPGDSIRFRELFGERMSWRPGEPVMLDVARGSRRFQVTAVAQAAAPVSAAVQAVSLVFEASMLVALGLCAVLLVRGWRRSSAIMLAAILVATFGEVPTSLVPHPVTAVLQLLWIPLLAAMSPLWPIFCLEISGGAARPRTKRLIYAAAAAFTLPTVYFFMGQFLLVPLPLGVAPATIAVALTDQAFGWGILALNYRRNDAATRNRIKIIFLAFACLLIGIIFNAVLTDLAGDGIARERLLPLFLVLTVFVDVPVFLLAYAVLTQRLFDFGFAINRTLVYGAVSFTLLASFGLAEWGADRLVPESWHKQSALYSAGIALLLFLSFHRLRDWFEHHVERVLFASWQRAEADLKRFVASAGHFRQAPALCREFTAEVERFTIGADAALYLREDYSGFVWQCGSLAGARPTYTEEDRAFALLASERQPIDLAEAHSAVPGAMAFPMSDQLGLAGFVLAGSPPDRAHYRPDEIDNLAWATQQVGLDLQALQARELRAEVATLRGQLAELAQRRRKPRLPPVPAVATA